MVFRDTFTWKTVYLPLHRAMKTKNKKDTIMNIVYQKIEIDSASL